MLKFPLMKTPGPSFMIIFVYLMFVNKWGPNFMKNRDPFKLDRLIQIYNIVQVVLSIYLMDQALRHCYSKGYNIFCEPVDYSSSPTPLKIARGCYIYWVVKVIDLLDTVFFVLRKKQSQVTFLHVYHHAGMVALIWYGNKYFAGGHSVFTGALNSLVHMVMYSYYFITSLNPEYKKNIWWKKHITQMQLIQFFLIICHFGALLFQPNCKYPRFTAVILIPQNLFMLFLFGDFYRKAYMKMKPDFPNKIN